MRLLVLLRDFARIVEVEAAFSAAGFWVKTANSLQELARMAAREKFDGVFMETTASTYAEVLESVQQIRARDVRPVLLVRGEDLTPGQRQELISAGVDAIFANESFDEATVQIRYLLSVGRTLPKQPPPAPPNVLKTDSLEIDWIRRSVKRTGQLILLRQKEFSILEFMVRHRDQLLTPATISNYLWGSPELANAVEVYMASLQTKLDGPFDKKLIRSIPGQGWTFAPSRSRGGTVQVIR